MNKKALSLLLGTGISFFVSTDAYGGEMLIQTGDINLHRSPNDDLSIDTGRMELSLPKSPSAVQGNPSINRSSTQTPRRCHGHNVVSQYSRQVNRSGPQSSRISADRYDCR